MVRYARLTTTVGVWLAILIFQTQHVFGLESFIGPSSESNRLVVAENSAIMISLISGEVSPWVDYVRSGVTNPIELTSSRPDALIALLGACELVFSNHTVVNYQPIAPDHVQNLFLSPSNFGAIVVPKGQYIHFYAPLQRDRCSPKAAALVRGDTTVSDFELWEGLELAGPVTLVFTNDPPQPGPWGGPPVLRIGWPTVMSYVCNSNVPVLVNNAGLALPPGNNYIQVQSSKDTQIWKPLVSLPVNTQGVEYLRVGVSR